MKRFEHVPFQKNFLPALLFGVLVASCGNKSVEVYEDPARGYIEIVPSSAQVQDVSVEQYADMTMASSRHKQAVRLFESCISLRALDKASYKTMTPHHCVNEKRQLADALELVTVIRKLKSLQDSNSQPILKKVVYMLSRGLIDGAEILPGRHSILCVAPPAKDRISILISNMPGATSRYLWHTSIHEALCDAYASVNS